MVALLEAGLVDPAGVVQLEGDTHTFGRSLLPVPFDVAVEHLHERFQVASTSAGDDVPDVTEGDIAIQHILHAQRQRKTNHQEPPLVMLRNTALII